METLFDEIEWALKKATIHCPDLQLKIWGVQKHVSYALNHSEQVDWSEVGKEVLGKLTALMVVHHELWDDLQPVEEKLRDALSG